jgi:hypothetical protein
MYDQHKLKNAKNKLCLKKLNAMKLKIIIVSLLLVTAFYSCKKDDPVTDVTGNVPVKTILPVLSQVMSDNQATFIYVYNSSKLISEEKSKFYFTINQYNTKNQLISTDYYSNSNILSADLQVVQAAMDQQEWVTPDSPNKGGTITYDYNANGQLTKSTYTPVVGSSQYSEFTYDSYNKIYKQTLFWGDAQTGYIEYSYDGKGNLVKEDLYNLTATGTAELITTTAYEFDNQLNPYKLVSRLMTPGINTNLNNIIKETFTIHGQSATGSDNVQVTQSTYIYNANGYPVSKNGNVTYIYS